jgi:outer membrane protein assembly factor BamB
MDRGAASLSRSSSAGKIAFAESMTPSVKTRTLASLALVAAACLGLAAQTRGNKPAPSRDDNWRLWGGNGRDFISTGTGIFPTTGKWLSTPPRKIWERALGDGYSAIAVEDGVLYTAYRREGDDVVTALDAATGKTIWEFAYAAAFRNGYAEAVGPGPYAMPQVLGDRVVTVSGIGQLHSIDKRTGKSVWSVDLYKTFGGDRLDFGYSSHALPYKDSLIVLAGGSGRALSRLRQSDGTPIWQKHRLQAAHSSPILIDVDGHAQAVVLLANEVIGVDPESGDLLWRHPHETGNGLAVSTPIWGPGNILFLSSAYEGGARGLKLTRTGGTTAVQQLWENRRIQSHFGSVIRQGNFVYLSSGQSVGLLTAVDMTTGRIAWQVRDFVKAQLLWADNTLVVLDEDGNLGLGLASPERFQAIAKWPLLTSVAWTPPTIAGNRAYVRDRKSVIALDLTTIR